MDTSRICRRALGDAYGLLKRELASPAGRSFAVGKSTFAARPGQLPGGVFQRQVDLSRYAILVSMPCRRFLSVASANPLDTAACTPWLNLPVLHIASDDERRHFKVEFASGTASVLRHKEDNGAEAPLPVVLLVENNLEPLSAGEFDERLLAKIDRGLVSRGYSGTGGGFVQGRVFDVVVTPLAVYRGGEQVLSAIIQEDMGEPSMGGSATRPHGLH